MKKQVLDNLIEFIKIDSFAFKKENVIEAQNFVKEYLKELEIEWREYESTDPELAPILFGKTKSWDDTKPNVTLTGHLDIVYPDISKFEIEVKEDKLFGPGTADMKAGVMVILESLKELSNSNQLHNINLLFTSEEEHFRTRSYPDFEKIALEIENLLVYEGEGSLDTKPNLNEKLLVIKRKGILAYKLKAKGPGGHSGVISQKEHRHSAIHELILQAKNIQELANYEKGTTINIGIFNGGQALNVLAPDAEIVFDARLDIASEYHRVKSEIENLKSIDNHIELELELLVSGYPVEASEQNKNLFNVAERVWEDIGLEIGSVHKGGASDMNRLTAFNPNIATIDYLGPSGGGEHTINEFLFLETFDPCVKLSTELIKKILKI